MLVLLSNAMFCFQTGSSALFLACKYGHKEVVDLLLAGGADVNLKTDVSLSTLILSEAIFLYVFYNVYCFIFIGHSYRIHVCTECYHIILKCPSKMTMV